MYTEKIEEKYVEIREKLGNNNVAIAHMLNCLFIKNTSDLDELNKKLEFMATMILFRNSRKDKNDEEILYLSNTYLNIIKKKDNFFKNLNRFCSILETSDDLIKKVIEEAKTKLRW